MSKQPFEVELIVTSRHLYEVFAYSPEGAIAEAEALHRDGEEGYVTSEEVEASDAFPIQDVDSSDDEVETAESAD